MAYCYALLLAMIVCVCASCEPRQDTNDMAESLVRSRGGKVTRDENLPSRPVVAIDFGASLSLRDGDLRYIEPLKDLESLDLGGTEITGAGLRYLRGLRNLQVLSLDMTHVTESGLIDALKELKCLRKLDLTQTRITDACLKQVKELKDLEELRLSDTDITDAGLKDIKELRNLRTLMLINTDVTDAGLKELKELKNLKYLELGDTRITDAGLNELRQFTGLEELAVEGTATTQAGLSELRKAMPGTRIHSGKSRGHHPNR